MAGKTKAIAEFGDFQTPVRLAREVCALLAKQGLQPRSLVEPTCGYGNLLFAGADQFETIQKSIGLEANTDHIGRARTILKGRDDANRIKLVEANFFATDWERLIADLPEPVLLLGNPPWVTNAHLGSIGSRNLPTKSNFHNHTGLDAKTGKANFDISEWMLIRLIEAMEGRVGTLAMLCKSSVARKLLQFAWKTGVGLEKSAIFRIDADLHFDAAVDAVLLVTHFRPRARDFEARVYSRLSDACAETVIGYENGSMLADIAAYRGWHHLCGDEIIRWRSGVKHDCSKVMELRREGTKYRNGLDELIDLEDDFLFPMLKSSDLAKGRTGKGRRWMIVPQRSVKDDTDCVRQNAPKTWAYLRSHLEALNKRASSIYRGRPLFSVFGVGEYSFAPWKVAISGFYKQLGFATVGPFAGKSTVLDDTSYFLPFQNKQQAEFVASLLNSDVAKSFFGAFVFWDSKRPITADLLRRLDLGKLADELGRSDEFNLLLAESANRNRLKRGQLELF
jgi:hypothetical protein